MEMCFAEIVDYALGNSTGEHNCLYLRFSGEYLRDPTSVLPPPFSGIVHHKFLGGSST